MVQSMEGTTKFLDEVVLKDYDQFRAISDQYNNDADVVKTSMENVEHSILSLTVVTEAAQNAELVDTCMDSVEQLEKIADRFTL